jgi:hypothetical protein
MPKDEKDEYQLEGEERVDALERLAERLGVEDLPDVVTDNLEPHHLWTAYRLNEEEYWGDVEKEARKLLDVYYDPSGRSRPPGRGKDRGAPDEVAVKPSENVTKRAEALAEVAATLCDNHPEVQRFRRMYLPGRLLTDEEARSFLNERGGPQGTDKAVRRTAPNPKWSLHPYAKRYAAPFNMRELLGLSDKLSKAYGWSEGDALWFVLTGYIPPIRPLTVELYINTSTTWPSRAYEPFIPRITVTAHAWVQAQEVEQVFRDAQRQLFRGDVPPQKNERRLEVVKFVARRMRERDGETWEERWKAWKRTCPKGWGYSSYNAFRQVYERFKEQYMYRRYNHPNYKKCERTPYEAYRDDWNDRLTRAVFEENGPTG